MIFAHEAGWSAEDRFAFDRMILTFERWVEAKKNETVPYTPPKDAQSERPKYEKLSEIFDLYDDTWDLSKFASMTGSAFAGIDIDAVIEEAYADDVLF